MNSRTVRSTILSVAAVSLLALPDPSSRAQEKNLPKFHQINERLYRGAQPLPGGFQQLEARGIKTVINLRSAHEHSQEEAKDVRATGLRYFSVPLPGFRRPKKEDVERVLALIDDPQNWPVFVHCNHGKDRTGVIIASYRISHDGWTLEQAMNEAKGHGLSWIQFGMKDFIRDYYRDFQKPAVKSGERAKVLSPAPVQ